MCVCVRVRVGVCVWVGVWVCVLCPEDLLSEDQKISEKAEVPPSGPCCNKGTLNTRGTWLEKKSRRGTPMGTLFLISLPIEPQLLASHYTPLHNLLPVS